MQAPVVATSDWRRRSSLLVMVVCFINGSTIAMRYAWLLAVATRSLLALMQPLAVELVPWPRLRMCYCLR